MDTKMFTSTGKLVMGTWARLQREGIPSLVGWTFLCGALIASLAALVAPLQMNPEQVERYIAIDPSGVRTLMLAIGGPIVISLIVGVGAVLWKIALPRQGSPRTE